VIANSEGIRGGGGWEGGEGSGRGRGLGQRGGKDEKEGEGIGRDTRLAKPEGSSASLLLGRDGCPW